MNELGREARALIDRVGNSDGPSQTDRERVRQLLGASLLAASTVTSTASLAAGSVGTSLVKSVGVSQIVLWLCVGGAVGTAVTAPLAFVEQRPLAPAGRPSRPVPASTVLERRPQVLPTPVVANADPTPQAPQPVQNPRVASSMAPPVLAPAPINPANVAAFPLSSANAPRPLSSANAPRANLSDETRLLERAQRARASGQPDSALEILDEYARRFPAGALRSESLGVQVLCLCQLGRVAEAQQRAEQLVRSAPGSPLIPRLARSCVRVPSR